jgi:predicted ATPase/tetratricopeptide (TPR) repeat protein
MVTARTQAVGGAPSIFVGRRAEIDRLARAVRTTSLLTLVGPAGVGKTRLASEVACRLAVDFDDDVRFVALGPVRDAGLVSAVLASALEVASSGGQASEAGVRAALDGRDSLLVFDSCEHVVAEVARIVDQLVPQLPHLRVLATSREPLRVAGEVLHEVVPLAVPPEGASIEEIAAAEAVALFVVRAREQDPGFDLTADPGSVAELCRRLDGLPLAIELAAGRVRALTPAQITERLDDRFRLLARGLRTAEPRHRTLRSAIEWSHALLDEPERMLFRRLAVFGGSFDLDATEAVCSDEHCPREEIVTLLASLVDRSLVGRVSDDPPRYALLETIREFAAERLDVAGETAALRDAHARWYAELGRHAGRGLAAGEDPVWLSVFAWEHDNFRVALDRLLRGPEPVDGARLAAALGEFWWVHTHGHNREGIRWLHTALTRLPPDAPVEVRLVLCYHLGVLWAHDAGDWQRAAAILDHGLAAARDHPDEVGAALAYARTMRAKTAGVFGDTEGALRLLAEAEPLLDPDTDAWGASFVAWTRGSVLERAGERGAAVAAFETALAIQQDRGLRGIVYLICAAALARRCEDAGDHERAQTLYEDVLNTRRELGIEGVGRVHAADASIGLARIACADHDLARARSMLAEAESLTTQIGGPGLRAEVEAVRARLVDEALPVEALLEDQGVVWRVGFAGEVARVADRKGLGQLRELVRHPDAELSALELAAAGDGVPRDLGDAGPLLDDQAKRAYRQRLRDLDEELADAEACRDPERAEQARGEREALLAELTRATGLGGRDRRAGSPAERARVNVTRTLRDAIELIADACPPLGAHLQRCVRTGMLCAYTPDEPVDWRT